MTLEIALASREETADVFTVLDDAAAYLRHIGVTQQWPPSFSADTTRARLVPELIAAGQIFVARRVALAVGVFCLGEHPELGGLDDGVWDGVSGAAFYLGLFAVVRTAAGQGVAQTMLDWAYSRAADASRVLRLDCWAGNERLKQYYLEFGFAARGDADVTSSLDGRTYSVSRFERGPDVLYGRFEAI